MQDRPHSLAPRITARHVPWYALLAIVPAIGMAYLAVDSVHEARRIDRLWADGVAAPTAEIVTSSWSQGRGFATTGVTVNFTTESDEARFLRTSFDHFGDAWPADAPITVRYIPSDPTRAVTSWEHQVLWHQWARAVFLLVCGVVLVVGAIVAVVRGLRELALIRRLAATGDLLGVPMIAIARASAGLVAWPGHWVSYSLDGESILRQRLSGAGAMPFLIDDDEVVVLTDGRRGYVLRSDGYPLERPADGSWTVARVTGAD